MSLQKILNQERPTEERNCPEHGAYTSTNYIRDYWTECPECMAIKRKEVEKQEEEKFRQEKLERERRRWMAKINGALIPERLSLIHI